MAKTIEQEIKVKNNKRIRRGKKCRKDVKLNMLSNNVNGLKNKLESLKAEITNSNIAFKNPITQRKADVRLTDLKSLKQFGKT